MESSCLSETAITPTKLHGVLSQRPVIVSHPGGADTLQACMKIVPLMTPIRMRLSPKWNPNKLLLSCRPSSRCAYFPVDMIQCFVSMLMPDQMFVLNQYRLASSSRYRFRLRPEHRLPLLFSYSCIASGQIFGQYLD